MGHKQMGSIPVIASGATKQLTSASSRLPVSGHAAFSRKSRKRFYSHRGTLHRCMSHDCKGNLVQSMLPAPVCHRLLVWDRAVKDVHAWVAGVMQFMHRHQWLDTHCEAWQRRVVLVARYAQGCSQKLESASLVRQRLQVWTYQTLLKVQPLSLTGKHWASG